MAEFVGRRRELALLADHLDHVRATGEGRLVSMRGRRQVGKSALVERFTARIDVPAAFFAATRGAEPTAQLEAFVATVGQSDLPAAPVLERAGPPTWDAALSLIADTADGPAVLVIDELPYLLHGDPSFEGMLQTVWDRVLSRAPLLVVLIGSQLSTMEMLGGYARPLYGRMREMVVDPLTPAETAEMIAAEPRDAIDAYLVTGGFPRLASEWKPGMGVADFVRQQLSDSTSPLVVVGERMLAAEFPPTLQAGTVLRAVGAGARTFAGVRQRTDLPEGSVARTMRTLVDDVRMVHAAAPLSAKRGSQQRYDVADHYLRFWLRFVGPNLELLLRRRHDVVVERVLAGWSAFRGLAVEPLVRQSLERLLPLRGLPHTLFVGAYWTRDNTVEVDLVGADAPRAPAQVGFVGSITWREQGAFDDDDANALRRSAERVPGANSAVLVGVSGSGFATDALDLSFGPEDLVAAWR